MLLLLGLPAASASAGPEPAVVNRPGFSNVWEVVPPGRVELNLGYAYARLDEETTEALGQALIRAGLGKGLELRLGLNSYVEARGPGGSAAGLEDVSLGLKLRLSDGDEGLGLDRPQAALILQSSLPSGDSELGENELQPAAILVLSWDLRPRVHLDSNFGAAYLSDGGERFTELSSTFALSIAIAGRWGTYLEYAGFFPSERAQESSHYLFCALTLAPSVRSQVDLGVGQGLNGDDPDWFLSGGLAYRW